MDKKFKNNSLRLLELIRQNTDKNHPASQSTLRKIVGEEPADEIMGDKGTYARRLLELAETYNTDDDGKVLDPDEWKIVYPGYRRKKNEELNEKLPEEELRKRNGKVYYNHPVEEHEVDFLISSIRNSHDFTDEEKKSLEQRLKNALCSKYYSYNGDITNGLIQGSDLQRNIAVDESELKNVEKNIGILRGFIRTKMMTNIWVSPDKNGEHQNGKKALEICQVSPYCVVLSEGYYWLIANRHERPGETYEFPDDYPEEYKYDRQFPWYTDELSAYRIDLISKVNKAYVPETTFIHRYVSDAYSAEPYERTNKGERPRKARYNPEIKKRLDIFAKKYKEIHFEHGKDITLN